EIADARADERFSANPLVLGEPLIRFYAGAPLVTPDGDAVGTICVIDREPRTLSEQQRIQLNLLAQLVIEELERRKRLARLAEGLAQVGELTQAVLSSPRPATAARALVDAVGSATGGTATLLRRAADNTYGGVNALDARPLPGGREALDGTPLRLANAPADELVLAIPGGGARPEFVLTVRYGNRRPDESDRAALELVAASFAIAVRNVALYGESERRRVELLDARATQAELVARLARDVRGPVTTIVGFARLLEEDTRFPQDAREALAVVRASGERVGEIASDVDLLSRIELAAVEPQWQTVDLVALAVAAGAVVEGGAAARVVADPDLLGTALGRLVEDGRRPAAPVRAHLEDLDEAVVLELTGTGASPAGESVAPTIGARLAARIVERHAGTFRAGGDPGAWWVRLTLPADPRRIQRGLRVLLVGADDGDDAVDQLRALGFAVETVSNAAGLRRVLAASAVDVVVVPIPLAAWTGVARLPADLRPRVGLVALASPDQPAGDGWDAAVTTPPLPGDLRAAVFAAAAKARLRRASDALVPVAH
ncbi:MAG TPA: histidine kinase dimerization/phospho-acceptor domain-containing protein, partial [Gemmatirosa sp.]